MSGTTGGASSPSKVALPRFTGLLTGIRTTGVPPVAWRPPAPYLRTKTPF
ncbi:hypothetical protein [Actinacidiphila soli]|nr:hypothetical protein [Actinacidiphila soli]